MSADSSALSDNVSKVEREPREKVDSKRLMTELRATVFDWHTHGRFDRLSEAQRIRNCFHNQRDGSGTYGAPPHGVDQTFPWHGAPDSDSLLVDQIIREDVDIFMLAWWMGQRSVRPRDVMDDDGHRKSEAWRHVLDFELDQSERQRADALELFANCLAEFNCGVWHEGWESQWRRGRKFMSFTDVMSAVRQEVTDQFEENQLTLTTDHMDQVDGALLASLYDTAMADQMVQWIKTVDPLCPEAEAKQLLRAWRKGDQTDTPYFAPVPLPGKPRPVAMIPGIDCIWPVLSERQQDTPPMWFFPWLTGAQVRARAAAEGWDPDWTKELLEKQRGMVIDWSTIYASGMNYDGYALNGLDFSSALDLNALRNADAYQIAERWEWAVDKNGLPGPCRIIHHGRFEGIALMEWDPLGTGKMPYMLANREVKSKYTADFRGIPHHLNSQQVAEKQLTDGLNAQTLLRAGPPQIDTMGASSDGIVPFARISGDLRSIRGGGDMKFMQVPDVSPEVIQWMELGRLKVDQLYMRGREVDPDAKRARRMRQINRACLFMREMEHLLCSNAREDIRANGALSLGSVNGVAVNVIIKIEDLEGELDIQHKCDVAAMDLELAMKKIDMLAKVLGFDRYGVTDFNKLYRILVGWVDADIASAAITTFAQATDREKEEIDTIITKIAGGTVMTDDELNKDAGNPQLRMARIQQWMQTPENQQVYAQRQLVIEQLDKLMAHYQFQMEQQKVTGSNAQIGRQQGVNPELEGAPKLQAA